MAARLIGFALLAALGSPAAAALPDPTAPPSAEAADGTPGQALLPLTAIKRVGNRHVAIIGGQETAVGGRYQDARVIRISESEVVLRRGQDTVVLKLYPLVDKRPRGK